MQKKKAISLIVLVITIIVMIILASAIIMSLDNTNIFNKAEEAVDKTNENTNMYLSELKLAERELEKIQGASPVTDSNPGELRVEDDTYYIESIDDLVYFSKLVSGTVEGKEANSFEGKTVKLTRLLDFNSDNSYVDKNLKGELTGENGSVGFTPIGTYGAPFKGTFDGDGAEIRNLYINTQEAVDYAGLFGYAENANFTNLGVTGNINSPNCSLTGGIVADLYATKKITITNCYSNVKFDSVTLAGGIAGQVVADDTSSEVVLIQDCYNTGSITCSANGSGLAGIVAITTNVKINRCYNLGTINDKSIGPVAGIVTYGEDLEILNSYNVGDISVSEADGAGGIVCYTSNVVKIKNSYNIGRVYNDSSITGSGGISRQEPTEIINCYNLGEIVAIQNNGGEIIAQNNGTSSIVNVYYDSTKKPNGKGNDLTSAIGMSLSDMKSQKLVDILNENIGDNTEWARWKLGPNGYPTLDI